MRKKKKVSRDYQTGGYNPFGADSTQARQEGWYPATSSGGSTTYRNTVPLFNSVMIPGQQKGYLSMVGRPNNNFDVNINRSDGNLEKSIYQNVPYAKAHDYFVNSESALQKRVNSIVEGTNSDKPRADGTWVSAYRSGGLSAGKAAEMLRDGTANKKPLTRKQKRYFQAIAHGWHPSKQQGGTAVDSSREADLFKANVEKNPNLVYAVPDPSSFFSDSTRFFPSQRWPNGQVPYIKDMGNLAGATNVTNHQFLESYLNNQGRAYIDSSYRVANPKLLPRKGGGGFVIQFKEGGFVPNKRKKTDYKKGGNWIKGAVNPKHKGYCTPMTKSTCTPRRKAFAMTMKKHHGFHKKELGGF